MFSRSLKQLPKQRQFSVLKTVKRFNSSIPPSLKSTNGTNWYLVTGALVVGTGLGYYLKPETSRGRKLATLATAASINAKAKEDSNDSEAKETSTDQDIQEANITEDGLFKAISVVPGRTKEDYQNIYNEIAKKIVDEDEFDGGIGYGPILVRLAWHASGTYDRADKSAHHGGNYGGTMHYHHEASDAGNNGLLQARVFLESIQKEFPWLPRGDLYTLAGVCAIQEMAGPKIPWRPGRVNLDESQQPPHGRLPNASQGATHVREVFNRMADFTDEEIVALIGVGHTIGKCHPENTGYDGPWTFAPNMVTNQFFDLLLNEDWQIKKWNGPTQFEDKKTQSLMMLPTDFALSFDPKFKKICKKFADDESYLFKVFARSFSTLLELGMEFPKSQEKWELKTLDEQEA